MIQVKNSEFRRILKFGAVGGSGIFVNEGVLWFFTEVIGVFYLLSGVIAVEASILSNFLLNDLWTFCDRRNGSFTNRLLKFNFARGIIIIINVFVLWALTSSGVNYLIANLTGIITATIFTYASSLKWVWKI